MIQKYLDHLPLYRIEKISERHGVPIARSTLAQWVGQLGMSLQPLVDRLTALLLQGKARHADETPCSSLIRCARPNGPIWAYRSNDLEGAPIVVFDYQTSRSGQHARNFLLKWRRHLMVGDYGDTKRRSGKVIESGSLAHCRRKFSDLHVAGGAAWWWKRRCGESARVVGAVEARRAMVMRRLASRSDSRRRCRSWNALARPKD
ncbi:MAG: transposase [Propionivibrio sp.]|nr:transposase [Propionivibrio sp.]